MNAGESPVQPCSEEEMSPRLPECVENLLKRTEFSSKTLIVGKENIQGQNLLLVSGDYAR